MNNVLENENEDTGYSGALEWRLLTQWAFDRLQTISMDPDNPAWWEEIILAISNAIEKQEISDIDRFDLRSYVDDSFNINSIKKFFPDIDYSLRFDGDNKFLTLWLNFDTRNIWEKAIQDYKTFVTYKTLTVLDSIEKNWGFELHVINELEKLAQYNLTVVNSWIQTDELLSLWEENFEWTKEEIEGFIPEISENNFLWLRDENNKLVAAMMVSYDSQNVWETTEWAVDTDFQWKWLIHPLLLIMNAKLIDNDLEQVYVHARYNRSVSAGIRSWYKLVTDSILTNHVRVEWEYTHFTELVIDKDKFSESIMNRLREHYPSKNLDTRAA